MVLAHDDDGAGPALVLLHAGIADRRMWGDHVGPLVASGYRVIAVDLAGFGDSPAAAVADDWAHVLATMDAVGVERAVIVGVSFGAAVALRIAVVAPERVRALVLAATPVPGAVPSPQLSAVWEAEGAALERGDVDGAVAAVVDGWMQPGAPRALRDHVAGMQRHAVEVQLAAGDPADTPDPLDGLAGLRRITAPALVLSGARDLPDFRGDAIERALPAARSLELASAGHLAPLEAPAAFRTVLLDFLGELPPMH